MTSKLDGKITFSELRNIAGGTKEKKLSLKEKIALKFFGKKIITTNNTTGSGGKF